MDPVKVVINNCYGGFCLSKEGAKLYEERAGKIFTVFVPRHDPVLVKIVEELGTNSYGSSAKLIVVQIPAEFKDCYRIDEYDGTENIDLSSNLLIEHELKQLNVATMDPLECKVVLLRFQKISETNYYDQMH